MKKIDAYLIYLLMFVIGFGWGAVLYYVLFGSA